MPREYIRETRRLGLVAIYVLCEPDTFEVRYVGKAVDPVRRYADHVIGAEQPRTPVQHWIAKRGRELDAHVWPYVVEWCSAADFADRERAWIAYGRNHGWRLLNIDDGGYGGQGGGAALARWNRSRRGVPLSDAHRVKVIAALVGNKYGAGGRGVSRNGGWVFEECSCGKIAYCGYIRKRHLPRGHTVVASFCYADNSRVLKS